LPFDAYIATPATLEKKLAGSKKMVAQSPQAIGSPAFNIYAARRLIEALSGT